MPLKNLGIILLLLMPLWSGAQNLLPPIRNYKIFEYQAASKNWGLAVDDQGELFAANNKGLLHFNGEEWRLYPLPNKTVVRSVAYIAGKVYTGSYEEFGYWEKSGTGLLRYTSLTHLIQNHVFTSEEFWQILPYEDSIVFRSFSGVYLYRQNQITVVDSEIIPTYISVHDNRLLMAADRGFFELNGSKLVRIENLDILDGMTIIDMVGTANGLLIGTKLNGCYLFKNGTCTPWTEPINPDLKEHQLNKILPLTDRKIAFGTIKNGIYIYETSSKNIERFNRETGLQNNTVLALSRFEGQLWAGLDNGIARIPLENPISYYTDYSGVLGAVSDLAFHDGILYLGSNTGIFYFEDGLLRFVKGSQGHVWDLETVDGELLSGHNTGTFKLNGGSLEKISDITGGYQFAKVPEGESTFLQGTYTGLARYQKNKNGSWDVQRVSGIDFPVKQLCFENAGTVWAAHSYKGLYRMTIDKNYNRITDMQEFTADHIPNNYNVKLYKIKNQIVVQSGGIWHKYDPILGEIRPFDEFSPYNHMKLLYHDERHFWFAAVTENSRELLYTDLRNDSLTIVGSPIERRLVPDSEQMVKASDSTFLVTLADGFGRINPRRLKQELGENNIPLPQLAFFKDEKKRYALNDTIFRVPFKNAGGINLQIAAPRLERPKFHYRLKGPENKSGYLPNGSLNFQNLPYGNYELAIATVGIDNQLSPTKMVLFDIAAPWYLSHWSMLLYLLVLIGTIFIVRWYNRRKLKRKQLALAEQLHRKHEERLASLEREKLEKEIKQKQRELTRSTMSVAKKNELILEFKDMLAMNKDAFPNKQRYHTMNKKLDGSINKDEDWKQFEINFKELHGDFFENLIRQFPKLTPKDLKLCAYLKMNLTSKEIAPLMGISIRGVEIHRYRLRKKLDMDSSQNLSKFLIKFN
ncbi:MAG: Two component regulator three Y domain-containing protein [Pricia sp.]